MFLSVGRLILVREEGRNEGDGEEVRDGGADDEGRGMGTGQLVPLKEKKVHQ